MKRSGMGILESLFIAYPCLSACGKDILAAAEAWTACYRGGGKLLICGNGGSAADAGHMVGELMKGFRLPRPVPDSTRRALRSVEPEQAEILSDRLQGALPAISLAAHGALTSAVANDTAADMVFAQQVYGYGRAGDVLVALSCSGNSLNVQHAILVARALGLVTVGLTGKAGGALRNLCDITIAVPAAETYAVQELHLPVYHALCAAVESEFFADGPASDIES